MHEDSLRCSTLSPVTLPAPTQRHPCRCQPTSAPLPETNDWDCLPWPRELGILSALWEKVLSLQGCIETGITLGGQVGYTLVILLDGRPQKESEAC